MILSDEQINFIKNKFSSLKTKDDLLEMLNYAKSILYPLKPGKEFKPIRLKALSYYADFRLSSMERYKYFSIKKKNGGERPISSPNSGLKLIQRCLNLVFSVIYIPNQHATGFVLGKSIVDNASIHVSKRYILNIDLKDFFPSIHLHRIKHILQLEPFNLNNSLEPLAFLIANLCCIENVDGKPCLPQGAPTSPILSNIICQKLDRRLNGLSKRFGAKYTRYADDITFSADVQVFNTEFDKEMRRIIEEQSFVINETKVRLQSCGFRQEVTGLIVNDRVNVSKHYIRAVRAMLHNWEKLGYENAEKLFLTHYERDKGHVKSTKVSFRSVLWGKLQFLKMVRGESDTVCMHYQQQFDRLSGKEEGGDALAKLEKLLSIWEDEGIDKAIQNGKDRPKAP